MKIKLEIENFKKIKNLLEDVNAVLNNYMLAEQLLPTADGFFFGSQSYDEWYFEDLKYTKEVLEKLVAFLEDGNNYEIIYEASW